MAAPEGAGRNGVLLVGEALGEQEAAVGKPFQGKAGLALTQMLQRAGLVRDDFLIDNALRCQPPFNRLNGEPYEAEVLWRCRPHLGATLADPRVRAVVAMGEIAFQRVCALDKTWKITPARGYVWRGENGKPVVPTFHPSYIMRGKHKLRGVFLADVLRAKRIAADGWSPRPFTPLLDPLPAAARAWADDYLRDPSRPLAYDIETPIKAEGADEGELEVDDPSYTILRIGFAWEQGSAMSIPFTAPYYGVIRDLLAGARIGVTWNGNYDNTRLIANGFPVPPVEYDMMWGWHVLNSDLPKGLAFVAPLYRDMAAWKHLSKSAPALYNAIDAEVSIMLFEGITDDLKRHALWPVFERHVVDLQTVFTAMSQKGLPIDATRRAALSRELQATLTQIDARIDAVVPPEAKQWQVYKKVPKNDDGICWRPSTTSWTVCSRCGLEGPKKAHFKETKKKPNPCAGAETRTITGIRDVPMRAKPWVPSVKQLTLYAQVSKHKPKRTFDKRTRQYRVTFDDDALRDLLKDYKNDPLYALVRERREVERMLSTYVGYIDERGLWSRGMPIGPDGKIHTTITNTPSTLRTSSQAPNLQNVPSRGRWAKPIKDLFVAEPDHVMVEMDYCVAPETRILRSDLTWSRADETPAGTEIISFSADFKTFEAATIEAAPIIERPRVRVTTTEGAIVVAADHRFVARYNGYKRRWIAAADLKPGCQIAYLTAPWETDQSRDGGYLAGFLDGEGWCCKTKVGYAQNEGPTLDRVMALMAERGFAFRRTICNSTAQVELTNGIQSTLKVLGVIRPPRLLAKSRQVWEGRQTWGKRTPVVKVLAVEPLEPGPVVALKTSNGAYISDGYFSHNCAIEAVLVGYEARDRDYVRLAKLGVHDFLNSHILARMGKIPHPADPAWSDADLKAFFADLKARFKPERESAKRIVHGGNYGMSVYRLVDLYPEFFPEGVKQAQSLQSLYFEVCPGIRRWQDAAIARADKEGYLRNPFGYLHRFWQVYEWEKKHDTWVSSWGEDAKRALAFGPQSTAAAIIKEAILRIRDAGHADYLRLLVHDSLLFMLPADSWQDLTRELMHLMSLPNPQLPLDPSWAMGDNLSIGVEAKAGPAWGSLETFAA